MHMYAFMLHSSAGFPRGGKVVSRGERTWNSLTKYGTSSRAIFLLFRQRKSRVQKGQQEWNITAAEHRDTGDN